MGTTLENLESQDAAIKNFLLLLSGYDGSTMSLEGLLENLAGHYGADRACVFEQNVTGDLTTSTHEWRKDSARFSGFTAKDVPVASFEQWHVRFQTEVGVFIYVDDELRKNFPESYENLASQGIKNLIVSPLLMDGKIVGTLAVENPTRHQDHLLLLSIVAVAVTKEIQFARGQKKELALKKHLEDDIAAIAGLASEYDHLFVINLGTGNFDAYVGGKKAEEGTFEPKGVTVPFYEGYASAMKMICHPEDLENMLWFSRRENIEACLKGKKKHTTRFRCRRGPHTFVWMDLVIIKFDAVDQSPTRISMGYVDTDAEVTAEEERQRELQDALKRSEAANEAKTTFLSNMSHDIRTPMNAVLGYARLMEKETENPLVISDYLKKIIHSGEYLLSIINNILDLAQIDSGKVEIDNGFMDIFGASSSFDSIIESELRRKNLKMVPSANIVHRYIFADSVKLRQIMVNLVGNAVKYTMENGTIYIDITEKSCDKDGYATYVTTVTDTGIGMSKEFQKEIFESFSREKNTTDSKIVGTGLGMAIVKKLVDLMGGTIEVESELGKGSTFRVTNIHRIVDSPEKYIQEKTGHLDEKADFSDKRVLLAEDNELNAEIAIAILEDAGLRVDHAEDGVVCINMLNKAAPGYYDLILMDVQMPNMDGYHATRVIRGLEDKRRANIPILAMTANAFESDRKKAHEMGMNGHLAKPIEVDKLMEAMRVIFRKP